MGENCDLRPAQEHVGLMRGSEVGQQEALRLAMLRDN